MGEARPILPVDLLARPVLALSTTGALTAFLASSAVIIGLPFRLETQFGFAPAAVGAMIVPWPLTVMVVAPTAGWLSDKVPAGILGGIGMAVSVVGLACLAYLPAHPGYVDVAWRMALSGSGFGLFLSPNARLIIGSAPEGPQRVGRRADRHHPPHGADARRDAGGDAARPWAGGGPRLAADPPRGSPGWPGCAASRGCGRGCGRADERVAGLRRIPTRRLCWSA